MEFLIGLIIGAIFTAAGAALMALGLGILHLGLPFETRWAGSVAILTALALNTPKAGD